MIDEVPNDPISEIQTQISRIDAEGTRYAKMAGLANVQSAGLRSNQAEQLLIGYLRFMGTAAPETVAFDLMERFQSLSEIFDAPLPLLRQSGLTNERALSGIMQHRLIREAIAIEGLECGKAHITPKALSKFLLTGRRPANGQIRILFLSRDSKLKKDIIRAYVERNISELTQEICMISLHNDAFGLILARYTDNKTLQLDDSLLNLDNIIRKAIHLVGGVVHDTVIVGPASTHSLSELSTT